MKTSIRGASPQQVPGRKQGMATLLPLLVLTLGLASCSVEVQNLQPAKELAKQAKPPGSVYAGWRVFQERCASCHGADAGGSASAPNLLPKMSAMGSQRFVGLVLNRYDWNLPGGQANSEAMLEDVLQGRKGGVTMPAWQGEPVVSAHITDLYAYLSARSAGTQGPGRPAM